MKKLLSAILAMFITLSLSAAAFANLQSDLEIDPQKDGTVIIGILEDGVPVGWCAVYLTGDYEGCAFWGFFHDGKATGILCLKDGESIPAAFENGTLVTEQEPTTAPKDEPVTIGMKNALKSANQYLSITGFSYSGIIKQLEFEGYTREEAVYAADHCGADWKEQALRSAQQYMSIMPFSRNGLIKQLEFEGYTREQAEYAATKCGY